MDRSISDRTAEVKPAGNIHAESMAQRKVLDGLFEDIAALEERLAPFLRPADMIRREDLEKDPAPAPARSDLAQRLADTALGIGAASSRVRALISRLD
jgi:hypothetical protein